MLLNLFSKFAGKEVLFYMAEMLYALGISVADSVIAYYIVKWLDEDQ